MKRPIALLFTLFIAACTTASADTKPTGGHPTKDGPAVSDIALNLNIQIGRFGAINDQSRDAIAFVKSKTPDTSNPDVDLYTAKNLYRRLYRAVVELNLIIVDGCEAGILVDEQCNTLWRDWLKFPGQEDYSMEQLQTYADDIQQAETFIWTSLCEAARKKGADEHFCAME